MGEVEEICPQCGQPRPWTGWKQCPCGYEFDDPSEASQAPSESGPLSLAERQGPPKPAISLGRIRLHLLARLICVIAIWFLLSHLFRRYTGHCFILLLLLTWRTRLSSLLDRLFPIAAPEPSISDRVLRMVAVGGSLWLLMGAALIVFGPEAWWPWLRYVAVLPFALWFGMVLYEIFRTFFPPGKRD
jgi:hypothetical protein